MDDGLRRRHAADILQNPLWQEIIAAMKADEYESWRNTAKQDTQRREEAWDMLRAIEAVESELEAVLEDAANEQEE